MTEEQCDALKQALALLVWEPEAWYHRDYDRINELTKKVHGETHGNQDIMLRYKKFALDIVMDAFAKRGFFAEPTKQEPERDTAPPLLILAVAVYLASFVWWFLCR